MLVCSKDLEQTSPTNGLLSVNSHTKPYCNDQYQHLEAAFSLRFEIFHIWMHKRGYICHSTAQVCNNVPCTQEGNEMVLYLDHPMSKIPCCISCCSSCSACSPDPPLPKKAYLSTDLHSIISRHLHLCIAGTIISTAMPEHRVSVYSIVHCLPTSKLIDRQDMCGL